MHKLIYIVFIISIGFLFSCADRDVLLESKIDTPNDSWIEKSSMDFPIEITDANATYQLFYQIRYDNEYPYYNLWINRSLLDEQGHMISKKLQGMDLFHSASGEPYGAGFGNYFDYKILSDSMQKFPKPGKYTIRIEQNMRKDTLTGIASVGVEIVKNK
ncbi:gliding motility lipoprotein GldH [uncultured Cytophaga sp.]|uniref:gliding motility lipoprotein GldH n=1 Tax=uncultured Cytophaga sp. TaxID=160238 RepID=UPI00260B8151|nr:gliding motility lipoprotein GldH [uncultured Cytophaga sp.]